MLYWLNLTVTLALLAAACGEKDDTGPFISHDSPGKSGDGGLANADAGMVDPFAPVVEILEPVGAADPNRDTVVTSDDVVVLCRVTRSEERGARAVDESSVAIAVAWADADGNEVSLPAAVNAMSDTDFEGKFSLAKVPNGAVRFKCAANDLSTVARTGLADVDSFLDLGPEIDILEPREATIYALKNKVTIKFRAKASPVSASDTEADLADLKLTISNRQFDTLESQDEPGLYTTTVDFDDHTVFDMAPETAQIAISAKSSRTPEPGQRSALVNIQLDSEGPSIGFIQPKEGNMVHGDVLLQVSISDASGVEPTTVVGTINRTLFELKNWKIEGTTYSQRFDTRGFPRDLNQLTIKVRASDSVGNEATQDLGLRLDNVPPILSLDPPNLREFQTDGTCSTSFDPVGDAINDQTVTTDISMLFRVMIWDLTNSIPGDMFGYLAGVDTGSVTLYVQRPDIPFLIDTDEDDENRCDEIKTDQADPADRPELRHLAPLAVRGQAFYSATDDFTAEPAATGCENGMSTTPPPPDTLCSASGGLTRAVNQYVEGTAPAIYGKNPSNTFTGECGGEVWDVGNLNYPKGWICLAARAEDTIGNVGVSPPLRICNGEVSDPECAVSLMPTCRTDCANPSSFADFAPLLVPYR